MYLSVIIPAYNEYRRLPLTLEAISQYLAKENYTYEIIVVDDGSDDQTVAIVNELKKTVPNLRLVSYKKNQGKGYAVKQGILSALGRYCLYLDADNAVSIDHIESFWPYFNQGYDIVIGSIGVKGAVIKENAAWYRRFLGRIAKYLIRITTIPEIKDTQRGFKLLPAVTAKKIFNLTTINGFGFDIEVLVIAKKFNLKIKEVPVSWINSDNSKVILSSYLRALKELILIKKNLIIGKYN